MSEHVETDPDIDVVARQLQGWRCDEDAWGDVICCLGDEDAEGDDPHEGEDVAAVEAVHRGRVNATIYWASPYKEWDDDYGPRLTLTFTSLSDAMDWAQHALSIGRDATWEEVLAVEAQRAERERQEQP